MSERLKGRSALVIGAARGIGAGIVERFIAEGARVVLADNETVVADMRLAGCGPTVAVKHDATDHLWALLPTPISHGPVLVHLDDATVVAEAFCWYMCGATVRSTQAAVRAAILHAAISKIK